MDASDAAASLAPARMAAAVATLTHRGAETAICVVPHIDLTRAHARSVAIAGIAVRATSAGGCSLALGFVVVWLSHNHRSSNASFPEAFRPPPPDFHLQTVRRTMPGSRAPQCRSSDRQQAREARARC